LPSRPSPLPPACLRSSKRHPTPSTTSGRRTRPRRQAITTAP